MRGTVLALALAALAAAGCGPIQASSAITRADDALREAHARGWDRQCPYEMAAAQGYVSAARDLVGRSEYGAAKDFADKAARLAASTREIAPRNAQHPPVTPVPADGGGAGGTQAPAGSGNPGGAP